MANKSIRKDWDWWVAQVASDNPKRGAKWIRDQAIGAREQEETESDVPLPHLPSDDIPSQPTFDRSLRDHKVKIQNDPQVKEMYERFFWPESLGRVGLPWEASPALLGMLSISMWDRGSRPTIRHARWYWRLCQASPYLAESHPLVVYRSAGELAAAEITGTVGQLQRYYELWLAFQPWNEAETDVFQGNAIFDAVMRTDWAKARLGEPARLTDQQRQQALLEQDPYLTAEAAAMADRYLVPVPRPTPKQLQAYASQAENTKEDNDGSKG